MACPFCLGVRRRLRHKAAHALVRLAALLHPAQVLHMDSRCAQGSVDVFIIDYTKGKTNAQKQPTK